LNLRDLRYLVAVAEHGHFGRAAEACHVSQPTLSAQLKKLEAFLGVELFERTSRAVRPTPAGERLVARARRVLEESDLLLAEAKGLAAPMSGPLALGIIPTLAPYLLPWFVPAVEAAHPELRLVVHEDLTAPLLTALREGRIDVALIALPAEEPDFVSLPIFEEPFFVACRPDDPLARETAVPSADLRPERLLLLTEGHCLRDQALEVCRLDRPGGGADFRAASLETLRHLVAAGHGCTLLPALACEEPDSRLVLRPLDPPASRRIGLVWRRSYPKAGELEALAGTLRQALPQAVQAI
jgi:LysR family hydrogen peroxide-inducible transcriptional activator